MPAWFRQASSNSMRSTSRRRRDFSSAASPYGGNASKASIFGSSGSMRGFKLFGQCLTGQLAIGGSRKFLHEADRAKSPMRRQPGTELLPGRLRSLSRHDQQRQRFAGLGMRHDVRRAFHYTGQAGHERFHLGKADPNTAHFREIALTAPNEQKSIGIEMSQVPGAQPAIFKNRSGLFRIVQVTRAD